MNSPAKDAQPSREGTYILESTFVNGKNHWIKAQGRSAIWYGISSWMIGNKKNLGSDIGGIQSNDDANGPHEASSWNYKKDGEWIETTDCILLSASGIFNTSICG